MPHGEEPPTPPESRRRPPAFRLSVSGPSARLEEPGITAQCERDTHRRCATAGSPVDDDSIEDTRRLIAAQTKFLDAYAALVVAAVDLVPSVKWASVTRGLGDRFETVAASDQVAIDADALQYRLGAGPCVDSVIQQSVFESDDLSLDSRWWGFGPQAARVHGTRSVLSIRLLLEAEDERHANASLNLYADHVYAFGAESRRLALTLVAHASIAIGSVLHRNTVEQLRSAVRSNREIGVAVGVLMATLKLTREQAFTMLREASQDSNRKLRDVASTVADTGMLDMAQLKRL